MKKWTVAHGDDSLPKVRAQLPSIIAKHCLTAGPLGAVFDDTCLVLARNAYVALFLEEEFIRTKHRDFHDYISNTDDYIVPYVRIQKSESAEDITMYTFRISAYPTGIDSAALHSAMVFEQLWDFGSTQQLM